MIGRTVSHYHVLSELGSGGMGVVYRAEDLTLGRHVALKFLSPHLSADPDARRRFVHEAKAAASLDHSGICTVHDSGEVDGQLFIAMALLEGQTLRDRIDHGPLPIPQALDIATQVADALAEAHDKGVVHRDIKPANIMLTPKGQAKVMDFGLAQVVGATRFTRNGAAFGTAAYMSPEQARGETADRRSDLWSLGVVLYEMVSGKRPFAGDHPAAMAYAIQSGEPSPLTGLRTGVPLELERVVAKCLAKSMGERFQHADELAVDLRRLRAADSQETVPLSGMRPARRPPRRRIWVGATLAVIVAAVGAWALLRPARGPSLANAALAVVDFEDIGGGSDTLSAAGLAGLLQVGLIERSPIRVVSPEYLQDLRRRLFAGSHGPIRADEALAVARKAGASVLLSGQIGHSGGSSFVIWRLVETGDGRGLGGQRVVQSDLVGLADGVIAQVVPLIASRVGVAAAAPKGSVDEVTTDSPEAYRQFVAGEVALRAAGDRKEEALRYFQAAVDIDSTFALAWARLADIRLDRSQFAPASECAAAAWRFKSRLGIKDRMMLESVRLQVGGRVSGAMDVYREMLSRWPDDRTILRAYSGAVLFWWFWPEAQAIAEQGLARYPDDESLGRIRAESLRGRGRLGEAMAAAIDYRRRHPGGAAGWDLLGEVQLAAGAIDSAESAFRRARDIEPDDYSLYRNLGRCEAARGRVAAAEALFERLLARSDLPPFQRSLILAGINYSHGLATLSLATGRLRRACEQAAASQPSAGSPQERDRMIVWRRSLLFLQTGTPLKSLGNAAFTAKPGAEGSLAEGWPLAFRMRALVEADSTAAAREVLARFRAIPDRAAMLARYMPLSILANLALAEGHADTALATLAALADYQALGWPELETRARAYSALHRWPEAAATLENLLRRDGSRFIARYQLGQVYEEMNRKADAAREYETFLKAWANADPGWPQVDDAKRRLAALHH